jgi:hypothetical protein
LRAGDCRAQRGAPDNSDWSFASDVETAQLETQPDDPHSVNTWVAAIGSRLYIPTSMILGPKQPTERSWVGHVADNEDVRIRLGGRVFERRAVRVLDPDEFRSARAALEAKYGITQDERDPEREVWIFRLESRAAPPP